MKRKSDISAELILDLLQRTGWSDVELARRVDASARSVKRWKRGTKPSRSVTHKLLELIENWGRVEESTKVTAMLFVDALWLHQQLRYRLDETFNDAGYRFDYRDLPLVLARELGKQMRRTKIEIARTHIFGKVESQSMDGPIASNEEFKKLNTLFDALKKDFHYEVEQAAYPSGTDVILASSLLFNAAIPQAYEIAMVVTGVSDLIPALQSVRRLGKRVAIASFKNSCSAALCAPHDRLGIRDFGIVWLDDLLEQLLVSSPQDDRQVPVSSIVASQEAEDRFVREYIPVELPSCLAFSKINKEQFSHVLTRLGVPGEAISVLSNRIYARELPMPLYGLTKREFALILNWMDVPQGVIDDLLQLFYIRADADPEEINRMADRIRHLATVGEEVRELA